jgi:hypothetical protein
MATIAAVIVVVGIGPSSSVGYGGLGKGPTDGRAQGHGPKNVWFGLSGSPLSKVKADAKQAVACLRHHGIPTFPAPKVDHDTVYLLLPHGFRRTSPKLRTAGRACQRFLPPLDDKNHDDGSGGTTSGPT